MYQLWVCGVVLVLAGPALAVVGGGPAAPPEPDAAVIFTQKYGYSARIEGIKDDKMGYYSFFGIRYAEPPVGPRRFQRPVRKYLAGEMMARSQCAPCPQPDPYVPRRVIGQEDCLCLNVFAPKMPAEEEGSPVVFFIHGGNYRSGSSASYGGQHLTKSDTILVTAQYRLGSLGYLSTGNRDASGNVGLFDLHTAMIWIQDYIQFFGGDPKRVIVMGQGSGGSAASLLAMSPEGRSATGVAALSGAPLSPGAVRPDTAKHAEEVANKTDCPKEPPERLLLCLRQLPVEKVVLADQDIEMDMVDTERFLEEISGRSGTGARVEGSDDLRGLPPLVAEAPADSLKNPKQKRVPMLTGVNSAETSRVVFGKYNKFLSNKLQNVKDFIDKDLVGGLKGVISGVEGLIPFAGQLQAVIPLADYYQTAFQQTFSIADGLAKIVEATGDALFNFPAYQTVEQWSGGGQAYLYSFEHDGNLTKGWHFLPGVALAEKAEEGAKKPETAKGPAHGDELAYIFEPLGPDGQSMGGQVTGTDARVRENFVGLISKFAHGFDQQPGNKSQSKSLFGLAPFSKESNQFLKIGDVMSVGKDFRFCQIGLWGNMADRVTGSLCKNLLGGLLSLPGQIPGVPKEVGMIPGQLPGQFGQVTNQLPGGILGGGQSGQSDNTGNLGTFMPGFLGSKNPSTKPPQRKQTQRRPISGFNLPFDLIV